MSNCIHLCQLSSFSAVQNNSPYICGIKIGNRCEQARLNITNTGDESTMDYYYMKPKTNLYVGIRVWGILNGTNFYINNMSKHGLQNNKDVFYQYSNWYNGTENIKIFNDNSTYTYLTVETPIDATLRFLGYETINTPNVFINSTMTRSGTILSLQRNGNYKKITQDQFKYISIHRAKYKINASNTVESISMGSTDIDTFPFIVANIQNSNSLGNIKLPQYELFNIVNIYDFDVNYFNNINRNQVKNTFY